MRAHTAARVILSLAVFAPFVIISQRPTAAQSAQYAITDLGTLGGKRSVALGLSHLGEAVGFSETREGKHHAFLYTGGMILDLGTLGGADSFAYKISNAGLIIGRSQRADGQYRPFITTVGGPLFDPSTISDYLNNSFSTMTGISSSSIVGYTEIDSDESVKKVKDNHRGKHKRAFVYAHDNMVVDLGTFGGNDAIAVAVNDSNQITGYYTMGAHGGAYAAFLLSSGGRVVDLGRLNGYVPIPVDVNNSGQVLGNVYTAGGETHACLYDGATLSDLGTFTSGSQSLAYGLNDAGVVVGTSDSAAGALRAFIYDAGVMRDLNELIPSDSGWLLTEARDINNVGQIVGAGVINGETRAFLLTPLRPQRASAKD